MSNPAHPYEPLTSENAALVLVDDQVGLMSGVRDYSIAELKHNVRPREGREGTEASDRRDHDGARQHVGTDVS